MPRLHVHNFVIPVWLVEAMGVPMRVCVKCGAYETHFDDQWRTFVMFPALEGTPIPNDDEVVIVIPKADAVELANTYAPNPEASFPETRIADACRAALGE